MCEAHGYIGVEQPSVDALVAARQRAEQATTKVVGGLVRSEVAAALALVPSLAPVPTTKPLVPVLPLAPVPATKPLVTVPPLAPVPATKPLPPAPPLAPKPAVSDELVDALLLAHESNTISEKDIAIDRLAEALSLTSVDIAHVRSRLAMIIANDGLKRADVPAWLSIPVLPQKVLAALATVHDRDIDTITLDEMNSLCGALGVTRVQNTADWRIHAFGKRQVGRIYEALKKLGYLEALPILFKTGLEKYFRK